MKNYFRVNNDLFYDSCYFSNKINNNSINSFEKGNNINNEEEDLFKRGKKIIELFKNGLKETTNRKLIINTKAFFDFENCKKNNDKNNKMLTQSPKINSLKIFTKKLHIHSKSEIHFNYNKTKSKRQVNSLILQKKNYNKCRTYKENLGSLMRNNSKPKKTIENLNNDFNIFSVPSITTNKIKKFNSIAEFKKNLDFNINYTLTNNHQFFNSSGNVKLNKKKRIHINSLKPYSTKKILHLRTDSKKTLLFEEIVSQINKNK